MQSHPTLCFPSTETYSTGTDIGHISYGWTQGFLQALWVSLFFLDKCSLSISRVYQGRQEAQLDLSAAVPLDGTCQLSPRGYSQLCIFCRERYLSRFLLSFISLPYFPTVPSSDRIKWECMQLSVVSLLRGFPRVWYRHTTCKIVRTRVRVPSWSDCSKGLFVHHRAPVHAKKYYQRLRAVPLGLSAVKPQSELLYFVFFHGWVCSAWQVCTLCYIKLVTQVQWHSHTQQHEDP